MMKEMFFEFVNITLKTYNHGPFNKGKETEIVSNWYARKPDGGHREAAAEIISIRNKE